MIFNVQCIPFAQLLEQRPHMIGFSIKQILALEQKVSTSQKTIHSLCNLAVTWTVWMAFRSNNYLGYNCSVSTAVHCEMYLMYTVPAGCYVVHTI